ARAAEPGGGQVDGVRLLGAVVRGLQSARRAAAAARSRANGPRGAPGEHRRLRLADLEARAAGRRGVAAREAGVARGKDRLRAERASRGSAGRGGAALRAAVLSRTVCALTHRVLPYLV